MPANPNPARISAPLWWFVEKCTSLTATAFSDEMGGTYTDKPGSHNTRDNLIRQQRYTDYSIRDALNKEGPGDKTAAFDWTFPSAQAGNYAAIILFSARIKLAWEQKDPRTYALQEVLCEADNDWDPEGYVFYPSYDFRVPDRTHKWHIHFGFIRKYLNDWAAFEAIFSIILGESLAAWRARALGGPAAPPQQQEEDSMIMYHAIDDQGTQVTVDDAPVFCLLGGFGIAVNGKPVQTLLNKIATPPQAPLQGSGNSSPLNKAEWNNLMDMFQVEGNRFVVNADGSLGDWVAEPSS